LEPKEEPPLLDKATIEQQNDELFPELCETFTQEVERIIMGKVTPNGLHAKQLSSPFQKKIKLPQIVDVKFPLPQLATLEE
jgi:hypothetical protein